MIDKGELAPSELMDAVIVQAEKVAQSSTH